MAVVIAVDAGTTGVRSMAVGPDGLPVATRYREFTQYFPRPGWVEHDPEEIWTAVAATLADLLASLDEPVAALGLTNQRETVVVWDRRTRRTAIPGPRLAGPPGSPAVRTPSKRPAISTWSAPAPGWFSIPTSRPASWPGS